MIYTRKIISILCALICITSIGVGLSQLTSSIGNTVYAVSKATAKKKVTAAKPTPKPTAKPKPITNGTVKVTIYNEKTPRQVSVCSTKKQLISIIQKQMPNFPENIYVKYVNSKGTAIEVPGKYINEAIDSSDYAVDYVSTQTTYGSTFCQDSTHQISKVTFIRIQYPFPRERLLSMFKEVEAKKAKIINSIIKPGMTQYDKELAIHDYIASHVSYAWDYKSNPNSENYSVYGALVKGKAVCEGYSVAFKQLCHKAGIVCILITGTADPGDGFQGHAWNKVQLDDKQWYNVDTTWDAGGIYDYFNLTDEQIRNKYHSKGVAFGLQVTPNAVGTKYAYKNPSYNGVKYKDFASALQRLEKGIENKEAEVHIILEKGVQFDEALFTELKNKYDSQNIIISCVITTKSKEDYSLIRFEITYK